MASPDHPLPGHLRLIEQALMAVFRFEHPADAQLARFFKEHPKMGAKDRALVSDVVFAVLRHRRSAERATASADWPALALWGLRAIQPKQTPKADGSGEISEIGQTSEPCVQAEDGVPLAAGGTVGRSRVPTDHEWPDWLWTLTETQLGTAEAQLLAQALLEPAPLDLRCNSLKTKREALQTRLQASGIDTAPTPHSPWGLRAHNKVALQRLPAYVQGEFEIQDEGSQLLAWLVGAKRNDLVVDFCAGAGGKLLAMGAHMRGTGRLYAFDTSSHRLDALAPRLARSGLPAVQTLALAHENDPRLQRLAGKADRVLVDAPCSGLGTLRRNPDLKWRQTPKRIEALRQQQASILRSAARLVKSGGRLVYATCSWLDQENAQQAQAFSAEMAARFEPLPMAAIVQELGIAANLCSADGLYLNLQPHRHGTDAFFAAAWQRKR